MQQESNKVQRESGAIAGIEPTQHSVTVSVVTTLEGFMALKADWNRLVEESAYATIFQTFEWNAAWWTAFGASHQMHLLVVRDDTTMVGICPLMVSGSRGASRKPVLQFIGTPNADYCDVVGSNKPKIWGAVFGFIKEHFQNWNTVVLDQITERSSSVSDVRQILKGSGAIYRENISDTCLAFQFEGSPDEAGKFELRRGTNLRKSVRQLEQIGRFNFRRFEGAEIERHLHNLFHLHIMRWNQTPTPSKFIQEKHRRFYLELARQLGPKGQIFLTALTVGSIPVAYCLKFDYNGTINHYTLAFNPYFSKFSPGMVFVTHQTEQLIRQGLFLDFSRGAQDYKAVITNRTMTNYRFQIFRSIRGATAYDLRVWIRSAKFVQGMVRNKKFAGIRARLTSLASQSDGSSLVRKLLERAWRRVHDHRVILVFAHEGAPRSIPPPPIAAEVRELTREHLPEVATFYGAPLNGPKYQTLVHRFDSGADCFGVYCDGNLATVSWGLAIPDIDPIYGFTLSPGKNEVVLSDGATADSFRGKGLRSLLLNYQLEKYHKLGKRVLLATLHSNLSMLGVVRKFDFKTVCQEHLVKLLGFRIKR